MSEPNQEDAFSEQEAATARWQAAFRDPEFMEALMLGVPSHPDWWKQRPDEDAITYIFRMFPVMRTH